MPDETDAWYETPGDAVYPTPPATPIVAVPCEAGQAELTLATPAEIAVTEFVAWVATQRAYNGSDHPHGQSLYNECLNAALPDWADQWLREREDPR